MTNEKDLISKDDIEKSNSLAIKSLDETGFDFIELLNEKYILFITLKKLNNTPIQIINKSILKIFKLFCDKDNKENLEENLLNHITCTITENNDFITINPVVDNSIGIDILDAPYVELLKNTKNYKINFTKKGIGDKDIDSMKKNLLIYEEQNNKLSVNADSIKKICKFLGKTIFDMSDYINVLLLYLNEDEINKNFIQNKILDKYNKNEQRINFEGIKKYETELIIPEKNNKIVINLYNNIFEKVLNRIDNIENLSDFSEENKIIENNDNIPKKFIEEKIKIKSVDYESPENNKSYEEDYELKRDEQCNCQKDLCSFCTIF
jgi:ribosomal protein S24E